MGWGSSTRRGAGRKVRALPRKFVFLGFRREESGMSREFCRDVPDPWGCSKSLCQKSSCHFSFPIDWVPNMTGRPGCRTMEINGGSSVLYLACTPCVQFVLISTNRGGKRRAFKLPGERGDHFHCAVEPSSGHIRCRTRLGERYHSSREQSTPPPPPSPNFWP